MTEGASTGPPATDVVGTQLRLLRRARRQTLRGLPSARGVSESFLSQLERGQTGATIQSLQRIAAALGVEVSDLFAQPRRSGARASSARDDRHVRRLGHARAQVAAHAEAVRGARGRRGRVRARRLDRATDAYAHGDSEELLLVVAGTVELSSTARRPRLDTGDSAHYRSSSPHRVVNPGEERRRCSTSISPPSY